MLYLNLNKHRKITFVIILSVHRSSISVHQFAPILPLIPSSTPEQFLPFPLYSSCDMLSLLSRRPSTPTPTMCLFTFPFLWLFQVVYSQLKIHKYERVNDDCLSWSGYHTQ